MCLRAVCESDTMIFGEADGGGELPETPGYAAAEFADRARGGGSRMSAVPFCAILEQGQIELGATGAAAA